MMYQLAVLTLSVVALVSECQAAGAGRAFPIASENYIIEHFQRINPGIVWDPTNYLVDKSGEFAKCDLIKRGYEHTNQITPTGETIGVLYDHINGNGVDVESVNSYLMTIINNWVDSRQYDGMIRDADRFGCSVRPGCRGSVTVACLVSPARYQQDDPEPIYKQQGQAFTKEQYDVAEYITGNKWDRSHFLENLSGFEITCSMLDHSSWPFHDAINKAQDYGMDVLGLKGQAPNLGSTQQAMEVILKHFKAIRSASSVGCSVIPDCTTGRGDLGDEMWVIVACIYQESF